MNANNYFIPLLLRYLQAIDVKCDPKELQLVLQSTPSFPSVLSIVQACTYIGLKATAYRADYAALEMVSLPAIIHIKQGNADRFVLLCKVSDTKVAYYDAFTNKDITILKDAFCTLWTGVVILSEKTENGLQPKTLNKYVEYSIVLAFFCLIILGSLFHSGLQYFLFFGGLLSLKLTGIWLSIGLLRQESEGAYSVFDAFCHRSEKFDCAKVVHSKASKLFNQIALADIGFVYFAMGIISLCIGVFSSIIIPVQQALFYLSVSSIPFILFSVLYQKIVVKKWCPLCLAVMSVLVAEVVLFLLFPHKVFSGGLISTAGLLFFSLFSGIGLLFLTKHNIKSQADVFKSSISALQLKRSSYVISTVFGNQNNIPQPMKDSLVIGNTEAPVTITTFLNPMCAPCKALAVEMIGLLESYPSFIQWHIRLDGVEALEYDKPNKPQLYLFELFRQNDNPKIRLDMIKEWFREQSLSKFSESYPLKNIPEEIRGLFSDHVRNNNGLKAEKVPSVWINNRAFPREYSLRDIPFLLTDMGILLKSTI